MFRASDVSPSSRRLQTSAAAHTGVGPGEKKHSWPSPAELRDYIEEGEVPGHLRCPFSYEPLRAPVRLGPHGSAVSSHYLIAWLAGPGRPQANPFTGDALETADLSPAPELSAELDVVRAAAESTWLANARAKRDAEPTSQEALRRRTDLGRAYAMRWLRHALRRREQRPADLEADVARLRLRETVLHLVRRFGMSPAAARAVARACPDPFSLLLELSGHRLAVDVRDGRAVIANSAASGGGLLPDFRAASPAHTLCLSALWTAGAALFVAHSALGWRGTWEGTLHIQLGAGIGYSLFDRQRGVVAPPPGAHPLTLSEAAVYWSTLLSALSSGPLVSRKTGSVLAFLGAILCSYASFALVAQGRRWRLRRRIEADVLPSVQAALAAPPPPPGSGPPRPAAPVLRAPRAGPAGVGGGSP